MSTPARLDPRSGDPRPAIPVRSDPVAAIASGLLAIVFIGLLAAGLVAWLSVSTPDFEPNLVLGIAIVALAALVLLVLASGLRHVRGRAG